MSTDPVPEHQSVLVTNPLAVGAGEHGDDERGSYICKSDDGLGSTKDHPIPTASAMVDNLVMNHTSSSSSSSSICNSNRWGIISNSNSDDPLPSSTRSPVLLLKDPRLNLTPHTIHNPSATGEDRLEHSNPSFDRTTTTITPRVNHRSLPPENDHESDPNNNNVQRPQGTHPQHQQTSNPSLRLEPPASNSSPSSKKKHKLHKNKEEEEEEEMNRVRKRKERKILGMKEYFLFFHDAMERLVEKQEEMQQKFLEALERRDEERVVREEALKRQEMARLIVEHDMRVRESIFSASRDSSLIEFLHKAAAHEQGLINLSNANVSFSNIPPIPDNIVLHAPCVSTPQDQQQPDTLVPFSIIHDSATAPKVKSSRLTTAHNVMVSQESVISHDLIKKEVPGLTHCTKRWPTLEVLALIKLRTKLNKRFHEPGSKASLWEEISTEMGLQGFNRPPKRCKEKWENINKYFKKAKENKKTRPENANTCPYFHHLNALYKQGLLGSGKHVSNMNVKDRSPKTVILGGNDSSALDVEEIKHPLKNPAAVSDEDSQGSETEQDIAVPCVGSMRNDEALTMLSSVSSSIIAKSNMLATSNNKTYQITTQI